MKTAAYLFLVLPSVIFASTAVPQPTSWMLQLGALGLLGWTIYYLLAKALPAHYDASAKEREAYLEAQRIERRDFLDSQRTIQIQVSESMNRLAIAIENLEKEI